MHPRWTARARTAVEYLFRPLQDVDVYVEDSNDEVFYTELFKRLAPGNVRISRVFTAGGRKGVIEKARSHDFSKRRALFVIDGDFEWVRGEIAAFPDLVHRLDAYCVENLLIHEDAIVKILIEESVLSEKAASEALQYHPWIGGLSSHLLELFIWFAALNSADPRLPTVSQGVGAILTQPRKGIAQTISPQKVKRMISEVRAHTEAAIGTNAAKELHDLILRRVSAFQCPHDIISGKDFLLPLLEQQLWKHIKRKTLRKSLRVRLARNCCIQRFEELSRAIAICAR